MPGGEGTARVHAVGLANTRWRQVRIGDRAVAVSGQQREPWIVLDSRAKRVTGSGGCNRIAGSFEADDDTLRFGRLISTRIACPAMDIETAFPQALNETRCYRALGRILELMDDRGRVLVRLEERNLR
jgi:heat shock protein HslJ